MLAALAKEKGLCLATYQNRRWDSDFRTVQQLVQSGAFGEISEFQVRRESSFGLVGREVQVLGLTTFFVE